MKPMFHHHYLRLTYVLVVFVLLLTTIKGYAQEERIVKQKAFEHVFGDAVKFDPVMLEKVKADTPGKRHYVDKDGDGKPEEVWFIDIEPRHNENRRPILVKVIDESGYLEMGKEPKKCGSLWVADWHAGGMTDVVINYRDVDGDGDLDIMEWYTYGKKTWRVGIDGLRVLVSTDEGDDNLLNYDIDYVYYQIPCQNHSHLGGNESFVAYYLNSEKDKWIPYFENPFLFYDADNNGITEEVIRVEGHEDIVRSIRWSFNVKQVAGKQRDFDVSISACPKGWTEKQDRDSDFKMFLPEDQTETFNIRGIPTGPVLKRATAREFLDTVTWERVIMTWNENNLNIAFDDPDDNIERWEGIINAASTDSGFYMPRIGAPDCGPLNKRYELLLTPQGPNEYYFNPADSRVHLKYSDRTWIHVDYDYDKVVDMSYAWLDTNHDGIMDRIEIDFDNDGQPDDSWDIAVSRIKPIRWTFQDLTDVLTPVLDNEPANKYFLIKMLTSALETTKKGSGENPILNLVEKSMRDKNISEDIARRLIDSDKTMMYYLSLIQDSQIAKLKKSAYKNKSFWKKFNAARSQGNTQYMTKLVKKHFKLDMPKEDYLTWINRLRKEDKKRVAWNNQWLPPNWGWESEKAAFRFYLGHFDLFGKRQWLDTLIMPTIAEIKNYHFDHNGWGMDILHVGKTAGCGGVTLYVNDVAYPVRNETEKGNPAFTYRLVNETSDKVTLEFIAKGVGPENAPYTVIMRPSAYAGQVHSSIELVVEGGSPGDKVELGIGMVRLPEETFYSNEVSGTMGSWGFQDTEIGWIGMGITFPPKEFIRFDNFKEEHQVVINCKSGIPITYHIQGDWLRGRQFPCFPSEQDWFDTLDAFAKKINDTL